MLLSFTNNYTVIRLYHRTILLKNRYNKEKIQGYETMRNVEIL